MFKQFREWREHGLVPGAWETMSYAKRLHVWLEWWASRMYCREFMVMRDNRKPSPSGLKWALYTVPWYAKYVSRAEFIVRNYVYPRRKL